MPLLEADGKGGAGFAVLDGVADADDFRMILEDETRLGVNLQRTEQAAEGDLLGGLNAPARYDEQVAVAEHLQQRVEVPLAYIAGNREIANDGAETRLDVFNRECVHGHPTPKVKRACPLTRPPMQPCAFEARILVEAHRRYKRFAGRDRMRNAEPPARSVRVPKMNAGLPRPTQ